MARTEVRLLSHLNLTLCVRLHSQGTHMPYRAERCQFLLSKGQHYFLTQNPGVNWNDSRQDAIMHLCTWCDYLFSTLKQAHHQHWTFFSSIRFPVYKVLGQFPMSFVRTTGNNNTGLWWRRSPLIRLLQGKRLCYRQTTGHASGTAVVTWFHWASTNISKATWIFLLIFTVVK